MLASGDATSDGSGATLPAGKCLGVYVCEAAALAAGVEDANQATIEIRDGQAVLGGAVVS